VNFSAIKTAIQQWAVSVVPVETIFANQDGNIPDDPFCTLYVQPVSFLGQDENKINANDDFEYKGHREISIAAQYFGANAMQNAIDLGESIETFSARDLVALSGLVFVRRAADATDLSAVVDTGFEERASIDVLIRTASIRTETPQNGDIIESVGVGSTYDMPDGSQKVVNEIIDSTP